MKSVDIYLCKEKKEVYKINTQPVIVTYDERTRLAIADWHRKQNEYNEQYRNNRENNNGHWLLGGLFSWWPF